MTATEKELIKEPQEPEFLNWHDPQFASFVMTIHNWLGQGSSVTPDNDMIYFQSFEKLNYEQYYKLIVDFTQTWRLTEYELYLIFVTCENNTYKYNQKDFVDDFERYLENIQRYQLLRYSNNLFNISN